MAKGDTAARIQKEIVAAMKARNKERLGVLRMLQAAIKQVEVDCRQELDEDGVLKTLSAYARKVKDQVASCRDADRQDLLARAEQELAVVNDYLPAELTETELTGIIQEVVAETGATGPQQMGMVMKAVMAKVAGRADGGRVSALVKKQLQD